MTDDTLKRFYEALIEALRERGPSDLERPFTVAEIYQDLVPYRTHRDQLGVEMNADYEHALLRLLAGEGGYLRLESEHALRDIRGELDEKSPNTTVYRDYAAVDVRLDPNALQEGGGTVTWEIDSVESDDADPVEVAPEELESLAPDAGTPPDTSDAETAFFSGAAPATSKPAPSTATSAVAGGGGSEDDHCDWCRSELPQRDTINYCPYCGQDQSLTPCRSCGEALEADWQFCIVCGAEAAS